MEKFGIAQPVRRKEDYRFLTGQGCYLDDLKLEDMVHGAVLRSPHAHARINRIDINRARIRHALSATPWPLWRRKR